MSQTTPAVAITSGTAFTIPPPSSSPWAFVVVTNLSPFLLLLNVQANSYWQAPFCEERFQLGPTAQPIQVTPSTPAGATIPAGSGAQVQATWYAPGEPIIGTWPFSLTSNVQSATVLGNVTVTNFPAVQAVSGPLTNAQLRASAVDVDDTTPAATGLASRSTAGNLLAGGSTVRLDTLLVTVDGVAGDSAVVTIGGSAIAQAFPSTPAAITWPRGFSTAAAVALVLAGAPTDALASITYH
jgi:hypothetical protein